MQLRLKKNKEAPVKQRKVCAIYVALQVLSILNIRFLAHSELQWLLLSKIYNLFFQQARNIYVVNHLYFVLRSLNGVHDILQVTLFHKSIHYIYYK